MAFLYGSPGKQIHQVRKERCSGRHTATIQAAQPVSVNAGEALHEGPSCGQDPSGLGWHDEQRPQGILKVCRPTVKGLLLPRLRLLWHT